VTKFARLLAIALGIILNYASASARDAAQVWFSPDSDSPDLIGLFNTPALWVKTRSRVDVIKFGPHQVDATPSLEVNSFANLRRANAFQKLRLWNIDIAVEAPAIKEWDCSAQGDTKDARVRGNAKAATLEYLKNVYAADGKVKFVAMDEPMVSGTGACHQSIDEAAAKTSAYTKAVLSDPGMPVWAPGLSIGDIEVYPSRSVDQLKQWMVSLRRQGFAPAFFHLDVDVNDVMNRGTQLNFEADIRSLVNFFHSEGIPFGIIFWSGYDPVSSDMSYYRHVIRFVDRVHRAIGSPQQAIFQSWVRRSSLKCTTGNSCTEANHWRCSDSDPAYCGKLSMPINLPESDPTIFSHTRLINDSLTILGQIGPP
jgi:hypothetical protein